MADYLQDSSGCKIVPVIIGSSFNAYGIVRSFGEEGIPSLLVTDSPKCFVSKSMYLIDTVFAESPDNDDDAFINALCRLGKRMAPYRGMLFPTHDEQMVAIAKHPEKLSPYYEMPFSGYETLSEIFDKARFSKACAECGVPVLIEKLVDNRDKALACLESMRLPLFVKINSWDIETIRSLGGKNQLCFDADSYIDLIESFYCKQSDGELLVQEYIDDSDRLMPNVNTFTDANGVPQCVFVSEKVRQFPPRTGTSTATNAVDPEDEEYQEIVCYAKRILKRFKFYGLAGIEFKFDARDNLYRVIEMNPRSEFPNYLQTLVGQNMAYQLYRYHLGYPVAISYYPHLKSAGCVVPFNDWFYSRWYNKVVLDEPAISAKERSASVSFPTTMYGAYPGDGGSYIAAYRNAMWRAFGLLIRGCFSIPSTTSISEFFLARLKIKIPPCRPCSPAEADVSAKTTASTVPD